jgi:hypothetical protein
VYSFFNQAAADLNQSIKTLETKGLSVNVGVDTPQGEFWHDQSSKQISKLRPRVRMYDPTLPFRINKSPKKHLNRTMSPESSLASVTGENFENLFPN